MLYLFPVKKKHTMETASTLHLQICLLTQSKNHDVKHSIMPMSKQIHSEFGRDIIKYHVTVNIREPSELVDKYYVIPK